MTEQPVKVKKTAADYAGQPKPWFIKPKRTAEEVAECRSPSRQTRRALGSGLAKATLKKRIVNLVAVGRPEAKAAIEAGTSPPGLAKLKMRDPEFKADIEAGKEEYEEQCRIAKGELCSRIVRITQRVGDTLINTTDEKLVVMGGIQVMRGARVLVENPVVAVSQDNRAISFNIVVSNPRSEAMLQRVLAGERTEKGLLG